MVSIARSPSSAIAVVAEQRADGPFTQTVLGVTLTLTLTLTRTRTLTLTRCSA